MQLNNKIFDELAKLASSTAGGLLDAKHELEGVFSVKLEKLLQNMNLATKVELDTALEMVAKLRNEQEELKKRLDALENK